MTMFEPRKRCSKCQELKSEIHDFRMQGSRLDNQCKTCNRPAEATKLYNKTQQRNNREKRLINSARWRAREKGLPFDLDQNAEALRVRIYCGVCELTGLSFDLTASPATWNSPSIDRVKPELGYVYSNIRVICHALNTALGYWGEDQTATLMKAWLDKRNLLP